MLQGDQRGGESTVAEPADHHIPRGRRDRVLRAELLAKAVIEVLDARGREDAEATFLGFMPDYFLNWRWLAPAAVVAALVEGNSIRATSRMTDVSKPTILKPLADLGTACADYHDRAVRNVPCKRVQADEVWSFVGAKQKNVVPEKLDVWGDLWTWTALDADTKLIVSYKVGPRRPPMAFERTTRANQRPATRLPDS